MEGVATIEDDTTGVDLERPNAARMYDYLLDGSANFAVDRAAIDEILGLIPNDAHYAQCNRAFLGRAVRYMAVEGGIDQFLDLGSGVPTVGNVHEIAHRHNGAATVAYVDFEPVAVRHARRILGDSEDRVTMNEADIRDPRTVLSAPGVAGLLDFSRPIGLLAVGILPFVPEGEVQRLLASYRAAIAPGSYLAISHISRIGWTEEQMAALMDVMSRTPTPERERTPEQIRALMEGFEVLEPGLVPTPQWRPDQEPSAEDVRQSNCYAAVGYYG